jgi:aerobic carbon-monoxide dehydrogenase large subunit
VAALSAAAIRLRRPLKWAEDRLENFLSAYQGRGIEAEVELALTSEGQMLGIRARIVADLGAYLYSATALPAHTTAMLLCGCYAIPAAEVEAIGMRTNKVPVGPYRGAGRPEAAYLLERTVDAAARELGIDPVALRRRNLITEFPHRTPLGWTYDSGDYRRCLERAVELIRPERRAETERLIGTGIAMFVERAGGQFESAEARIEANGRVIIASGSSPHGQGHDTTFAQLAADRLGLSIDEIELRFGDTASVPPGVGTFASRSVAMGGSAVVLALDELRAKCTRLAAKLLDVPEDRIEWSDGVLRSGERELAWGDLAAAANAPDRLADGDEPGLTASARFESDLVFSSGAYAAVVEIERATGILRVLRIAAVDDAGRIVNPLLAEGQVLGATVQGLGQSLVEEAVYDEAGQLRTASFADYSLLTAAEVPPISSDTVESASPLNPLGAKGIGEGGAIGTPAAVANAVADALGGADIDPPFTERKLWQALQEVSE